MNSETRAVPWCAVCEEPVRRDGAVAVHATQQPRGHEAVPTTASPVMKAEAQAIEAAYGDAFRVTVQPGRLVAWGSSPGSTGPYAADTGDELRALLAAAVLGGYLR